MLPYCMAIVACTSGLLCTDSTVRTNIDNSPLHDAPPRHPECQLLSLCTLAVGDLTNPVLPFFLQTLKSAAILP